MITVSKPQISVRDGWVRLAAQISCDSAPALAEGVRRELFFAVPEKFRDFIAAENSSCFLLALLYFAMRNQQDLHLQGTVSASLLRRVNTDLVQLMALYNIRLSPIRVTAAETAEFPAGTRIGTGYSGGVDSSSVFVENYFNPVTPDRKITDLFFFNVGTHGLGNTPEELAATREKFLRRFDAMKKLPEAMHLPFIPVDSNVHSFLPDNVASAIDLVNGAAVHFLSRGIRHYFIAATYDYRRLFTCIRNYAPADRIDMSYIETLAVPLMETPAVAIWSVDTELSRIEKVERLHKYDLPVRFLNVCNSTSVMEKNCSVCLKCRRTLCELEILGVLDQYRDSFDVDRFRKKYRSRDFAEIVYPDLHTPYQAMMKVYADRHGFDLAKYTTSTDRFCARLHRTALYHLLQKLSILKLLKKLAGRA